MNDFVVEDIKEKIIEKREQDIILWIGEQQVMMFILLGFVLLLLWKLPREGVGLSYEIEGFKRNALLF